MSVMSFSVKLAGALFSVLLAVSAQANLIVNGGFEDNVVPNGSWRYFTADNVNGWEGSNVEIWNHLNGVVAPEGNQHAELNAHPGNANSIFSIYQDFATVIGMSYDVSFFYSARSSANEAFNFSVASLTALVDDHIVGRWNQYNNSFRATDAITRIRFTNVSTGTVGNFLDGISVVGRASVPEASSFVLLMVGLMGLLVMRRKAQI
jgi:hypothetical protein